MTTMETPYDLATGTWINQVLTGVQAIARFLIEQRARSWEQAG